MNRQARFSPENPGVRKVEWESFGGVTHKQAAEMLLTKSSVAIGDDWIIETRDGDHEWNPDAVQRHVGSIEAVVKVRSLRGD